jgi:hypothetical protein
MCWVKRHIWLLAIVFIAVLAFIFSILTRRKDKVSLEGLIKDIKLEKKVIEARASASKMLVQQGRDFAAEAIKKEYEKAIDRMNEEDKKKIDSLSSNPEALVEMILRSTP